MPHVDARGLEMTGAAPAILSAYQASLSRLLAGESDPLHPLDAAGGAPEFAMGHALRAAMCVLDDRGVGTTSLADTIDALERCAGFDRERRHADAARAWQVGNVAAALARYGAIATDFPCDAIALRVAHALDFRFGDRTMLRDRVAAALPSWRVDMPDFGHILAMHAFGLEENGDLDAAEEVAYRALALEPRCASAVHVLAHVCEMRGRAADGIAVLARTRSAWQGNPGLERHILWHLAVFYVDQGDLERASGIYDEALAPARGTTMAALVDASALLWRLELRGLPLPGRWRALADAWWQRPLRSARVFNVVHAVIALAGARRFFRARRAAGWLRRRVAQGRDERREDLDLGTAFCAALIAFARGDYGVAANRIAEVRASADRCGGSVAQCDLIHLTLIEAALRGERDRLARALVAERVARKPASRLSRWLFARTALSMAA